MNEADLRALLNAYTTATGYHLTLTYQRQHTLTIIYEMGITPQDITNVVRELKRLMRDNPRTYTETCIQWRNCMEPDTLEERVQVLRQREARKAKPPPQIAREQKVGSDVIRVLDSPPQQGVPKLDVRAALTNLAQNLKSA